MKFENLEITMVDFIDFNVNYKLKYATANFFEVMPNRKI